MRRRPQSIYGPLDNRMI